MAWFSRWLSECCWIATCIVALTLLTGCGEAETKTEAKSPPPEVAPADHIAMLYYRGDTAFSKAVRDGATNAAEEFDLNIEWMEAEAGNIDEQLKLLETAIQERVRGICICPLDDEVVVAALQKADEAGIPVVVFEREMTGETKIVSCATTDHFHAGVTMAKFVGSQSEDEMNVLLFQQQSETTAETRLRGFEYAATNDLENVTVTQFESSDDPATALRELDGETYDAIVTFSVADSQTVLRNTDLSGNRFVCGFGAWPGVEELLQNGKLKATLLEDPYIIGYFSVKALSMHFAGEETGPYISPGERIVTAENIEADNIQRLLESNRDEATAAATNNAIAD